MGFVCIVESGGFRIKIQGLQPDVILAIRNWLCEGINARFQLTKNDTEYDCCLTVLSDHDLFHLDGGSLYTGLLKLLPKDLFNGRIGSLLPISTELRHGWQAEEFIFLSNSDALSFVQGDFNASHHSWLAFQARLNGYLDKLFRNFIVRLGGLFFHASGVSLREHGFLFVGRSGAGKSTAAHLSHLCGADIFHDDKSFLLEQQDSMYLIQESAGISVNNSGMVEAKKSVPLAGVFLLRQDTVNKLTLIGQTESANALCKSFLDGSQFIISGEQQHMKAMHFVARLVKKTPIYALSFRKDTSFVDEINHCFFNGWTRSMH